MSKEQYLALSFKQLGNALSRLEEALQKPLDKDNMNRDATIQRFEFNMELFWKIMKKLLLLEKITTASPRDTLQKAYSLGWFNEEKLWLRMMDDRNNTSHTYREEKAEEIYHNIRLYYPEMKKCYEFLRTKYKNELNDIS